MSNLLNLKGVKFFAIIVLAVAILATFGMVATTASAQQAIVTVSDIQFAATVRLGSSGQAALIWQRFINGYSTTAQLVEDGKFGPLTSAQARAWQSSRGLVADGVLGPLSRAAAIAQIMAGGPASAFPAGCTTWTGYSTVTGMSCSSGGGGSLPAGCTSTAGFSTTTGARCDSGSSLPAGCSTTAGFSPTTGASCSGGGSPSGPLMGGVGDLQDADVLSTYSNEEVLEGENSAKIMAFELEADNGSDLRITSVNLAFANTELTAGSSTRFNQYVDSVEVWHGSTLVGSADVDGFSESNDVWSRNINLSNAIVRDGQQETFVVAVNAISNIDSDDLDNDWTVGLESVRFEDASGAILTNSSTGDIGDTDFTNTTKQAGEQFFSFQDLTSSGDIEVRLSRGSASPVTRNVEVDDINDTNDVLLLEFNIRATGTDMTIDNMQIDISPLGADANVIVKSFILQMEGNEIDSIASPSIADAATAPITFTDLEDDIMIEEGDTVTFRLLADINDTEAGIFVNGDSILASYTSVNFNDIICTSNLCTAIDDENGDTVLAADRTGSATGERQTFFTDGVDVDLGTVTFTETVNASGQVTKVSYTIPFTVAAFGENAYIPTTVGAQSVAVGSTNGLSYEVENSADAIIAAANVLGSASSITSNATIVGGRYEVAEGDSENFSVTISMDGLVAAGGATYPGFFRIQLLEVGFSTTSAGTVAGFSLTPETDYDTFDRSIDVI